MYDISLYGHLVLDSIHDKEKITHELGGIANVWRSIKSIDSTLNVFFCPIYVGQSRIDIDRENSFRKSTSFLNELSLIGEVVVSKINHIAYINEIENCNFIDDLHGIISADLCTGKKLKSEVVSKLDYIFVSEEDYHLIESPENVGRNIIIHSPRKSYLNTGYEISGEFIPNMNVLGAGDYFAASFLNCILNNCKVEDALEIAHKSTTKYLREKNEKA